MVPKVINYIHIDTTPVQEAAIPVYNKLCIDSALTSNPDYKVKLYSNKPITGLDKRVENIPIDMLWYADIQKIGIQKVAHMADFIRYKILYEEGGIYSDTDILIIKSLDDLLDNDLVVSKQSRRQICNGFIMCSKYNRAIHETLDNYYQDYRGDKWTYNSMIYLYDRILSCINDPLYKINIIDKENMGFHYPHFNKLLDIMSSGSGCEECYAHHLWNSSPQGRVVRKYIENYINGVYNNINLLYLDKLLKEILHEESTNIRN